MFNQRPALLLQSLDQTCFQTMRHRHGLRISRWLAAFRWRRRRGGPACVWFETPFLQMHIDWCWFPVGDLGLLFAWLACDALAGTTRKLIPACRLWQGDVDKSCWHSPEAHGACCDLTSARHVTDMWRTYQKPHLSKSVIAHREKAVQFLCVCRLKTVSFAALLWVDVGFVWVCRPPQ